MAEESSTPAPPREDIPTPEHDLNHSGGHSPRAFEDFWGNVLPPRAHDVFLPRPLRKILQPGEELKMIVYQAWYRDVSAYLLYKYPAAVGLVVVLSMLAIWFYELGLGITDPGAAVWLPLIILVALIIYALYENFSYLKWRLVVTDRRIILATPQPDAWYLSDTIELTGKPQVIDSNWSDTSYFRLLQMITGSRDLYISLQGLQFVEGSAKVKDALIMPDVKMDHIDLLKAEIQGG